MGVAGDPGVVSYFDEMAVNYGYGFKKASDELRKKFRKFIEFQENVKKEIEEHIAQLDRQIRSLLSERERSEHKGEIDKQINKLSEEISILKSSVESEIDKRMEQAGIKEDFKKTYTLYEYIQRYDFDNVYTYWARHGSEAEESVAYHVIAKYMFIRKDKLWKEIFQIPNNDYRDPDVIIDEANRVLSSMTTKSVKMDLIGKINSLITAVAAKYIEGHLKTTALPEYGIPKRLPNNTYERDKNGDIIFDPILNFCKNHKMQIFIETNMPGGYGESTGGAPPGELRIIRATDHIRIIKTIDPDVLSYTIDFEHLLTNYVDPIEEAKELRRLKWGGYINCLHINAPKPIAGTHGPIPLYSKDMYTLYKFLYELRQRGWKNSYMIWEMGSFGVGESSFVFRKFVDALKKDISPEKLSKEFFGIDKNFEARQMNAIMDHAFDPLDGLLMVPEEKHTFFFFFSIERGKTAEWDREKDR